MLMVVSSTLSRVDESLDLVESKSESAPETSSFDDNSFSLGSNFDSGLDLILNTLLLLLFGVDSEIQKKEEKAKVQNQ